ncbi:MAG: hypothetical protein CM15mP42_11830 [Methanobacteriota archaeon]|nr:MAG: hypothetical protein CM15mP42_11830 [Euryarchaeota archaeon]
MERTENRPIQSGFISPNHALIFGICISLLGVILVSTLTNISAGIITAAQCFVLHCCVHNATQKKNTSEHCN